MAGQTPKGSVPPELENWQRELSGRSPEDVLAWAAATFHGSVAFTTSLGLEDQVLTDMIARVAPGLSLFTLDTGRLFNETYDLIERTVQRYGLSIRICFPETEEVRDMVETDGVNLFIAGGAGGGLDHECPMPPPEEGLPDPWKEVYEHHRLRVDAGCDLLVVEALALDEENTLIDRVEIPWKAPPPL